MPRQIELAALLAQAGWLKGLARGLVLDDARADDVVQQTWLKAIEQPPREPKALPAWLAVVARNEARQTGRSEGARTLRQKRVARPEASVLPAADVAARAELHEELVRRVFALPEPQKTTVLLRYFDGLEPSAIARRLAVPASTVRSRLKRGLDSLRTDLDRECGGDRRAWVAVLAPWAGLPRTAPTAVGATAGGALAMSAKTKAWVGLLVLLLLGGFLGWSVWRGRTEPSAGAEVADRDVPAAMLRGRPEEPDAPVAPPANDEESTTEPVASDTGAGPQVLVTFTDETGRRWTAEELREAYRAAGIEPRLTLVRESQLEQPGITGLLTTLFGPADAWQVPVDLTWTEEGAAAVSPEAGKWRVFLSRPSLAPYLSDAHVLREGETAALDVPLPRQPRRVTVRLLEASTSEPLVGARVTPYHEIGDDSAFLPGAPLTVDARGEVTLPAHEAGQVGHSRSPTWWVETDTHARALSRHNLVQHDDSAVLEWVVHPTASATGHAWTSAGEPAVGLEMLWIHKGRVRRATITEDGTYNLTGIALGHLPESVEDVALWEDPAKGVINAGRLTVRAGETTEADIGAPASLSHATLVGRISAGERPLEGMSVMARQGPGDGRMAQTDADGRYRIAGLEEGACEVRIYFGEPWVIDDYSARTRAPLHLAAGSETKRDFVLPEGAILLTVVRDEDDEPVAGGLGLAHPANREVEAARFAGFIYRAGWGGRTGADGTILLLGLVPHHSHVLVVGGTGREKATLQDVLPGTVDAPAEITVRLKTKRE